MSDIQILLNKLRSRLLQYREYKQGKEVSLHVNSIEIALCLAEFHVIDKRQILPSEKPWFTASYYVQMVLENSEWEDISDLYMELCEYING